MKINLTKGKKIKKIGTKNLDLMMNWEPVWLLYREKKLKIKRIMTNLKNIIYVKIRIDGQNWK